jgi:hypothetical protein
MITPNRSRRRRVSYGGRIRPLRVGVPWGPAKLYYFRNYSARLNADGLRGGFTSHGIHLRLPMSFLFGVTLAIAALFVIGGIVPALIVGALVVLAGRRRLGALVINKNWSTGVLTVNPPGWGSFRILPKRSN